MNNQDTKKLKSIIQELGNLEDLSMDIEKSTGGKFTFSQLKSILDLANEKMPKADKIFLLKQFSIANRKNTSTLIKLIEFFFFLENISRAKINSPVLSFYWVADIIENKLNVSTLEFIYNCGLSLEQELNVNEFYKKIASGLKLDDLSAVVIFKGLDFAKKGRIKIEDFVLVIDSYRDDYMEENKVITNNYFDQVNPLVTKAVNQLKKAMDENFLSVNEIYTRVPFKTDIGGLYSSESDLVNALLNETNREGEIDEEVKESTQKIFKLTEDTITTAFSAIKKDGYKIYKLDFEMILEDSFLRGSASMTLTKTQKDLRLDDAQIYWLNKLIILLEGNKITPQMLFSSCCENLRGNILPTTIVNLDTMKRKLKLTIPPGKINMMDLNSLIDSLDRNRNRLISYKDFSSLIESVQKNSNDMIPTMSTLPKIGNKSNNTWNKGSKKSVTYHLLPHKGNYKVLKELSGKIQLESIHIKKQDKSKPGFEIEKEQTGTEFKPPVKEESKAKEPKPLPSLSEKDDTPVIDAIETIVITDKSGIIPIAELSRELLEKLSPQFSKPECFELAKTVDLNKDGYASNLDLMAYLLREHHHRSSKLAYREVARKIKTEYSTDIHTFFTMQNMPPNAELRVGDLLGFLDSQFSIEKVISKKIYADMQIIYHSTSNRRKNLMISDFCDLIQDAMDSMYSKGSLDGTASNRIHLRQANLTESSFEEGISNFVSGISTIETANGRKSSAEIFRENLKSCLATPLGDTMSLNDFRENFVRPLNMDMNLSIAIFQLLKTFNNKDEQIIKREDLLMLLESYVKETSQEKTYDPRSLVQMLENNGCALKLCLDSLPYFESGFVTAHELLKRIKAFYPSVNKSILYTAVRMFDRNRNGSVCYSELQEFLYENSSKSKFSPTLEIYKLCSFLDRQRQQIKTIDYFTEKGINDFYNVSFQEHSAIFDFLSSTLDIKEEFFIFLSEKTSASSASIGRRPGYNLIKLIDIVDYYRTNKPDQGGDHIASKKNDINRLSKMNDTTKATYEFLKSIHEEDIKIDSLISSLNFSDTKENLIPITHIFTQLRKYAQTDEMAYLYHLMKLIDINQNGAVPYQQLMTVLSNILGGDSFTGSIYLQAKYLSNVILSNKAEDGNMSTAIEALKSEKGVKSDLIDYSSLDLLFGSFFPNKKLLKKFYIFLVNDSNPKANMTMSSFDKGELIPIDKLKEILLQANNLSPGRMIKSRKELMTELGLRTSDDLDGFIGSLIQSTESRKVPFKFLFNSINPAKVNLFGRINFEFIEIDLFEKFGLKLTKHEGAMFCEYFTSMQMFDLFGLMAKLAQYSERSFDSLGYASYIEEVKNKMVYKISEVGKNGMTADDFLTKFNLKADYLYNVSELASLLPPILKISIFDTFLLFSEHFKSEEYKNSHENSFKMTINSVLDNYQLRQYFKQERVEEEKIDSSLKIALKRLSDYLLKDNSKEETKRLFVKFDRNGDGTLSIDEFKSVLNSLPNLNINDAQKMQILHIVDRNKDEKLNYEEFVDFLNMIRRSSERPVSYREIGNKNFRPKLNLDLDLMSRNISFNKANSKNARDIDNFLISLQRNFHENYDRFSNLENDLVQEDRDLLYVLPRDQFFSVLGRHGLDLATHDLDAEILDFAHKDFDKNLAGKLNNERKVNYSQFLRNLAEFKVRVKLPDIKTKSQFLEEEVPTGTEYAPGRKIKKVRTEFKKKKEEAAEDLDEYADVEAEMMAEFEKKKDKGYKIKEDTRTTAQVKSKEEKPKKKRDDTDEEQEPMPKKKKNVEPESEIKAKPKKKKKVEPEPEPEPEPVIETKPKKKKKVEPEPEPEPEPDKKKKKKRVDPEEEQESKPKKKKKVEPEPEPEIQVKSKKKKKKEDSEEEPEVKPRKKKNQETDEEQDDSIKRKSKRPQDASKQKPKEKSNSNLHKVHTLKNAKNEDLGPYEAYNYKIKEEDYYVTPYIDPKTNKPKKYTTIFNSEDAAIQKCEEIFRSADVIFTDPEFGSNPNDPSKNGLSLYITGKEQKGNLPPQAIEWYRMDQIFTGEDADEDQKNPVFLDEGAESNDVMQGALGDCWFISALSVIATKSHLLKGEYSPSILDDNIVDDEEMVMMSTGVYPPMFHGFRKKRIYCFRFFKNFQWRYVIIDDRLPCRKVQHESQSPKLLYAKCRNEREFWVPLIEKAYAKLHGSYESLISGFIDEGLVDLTGLVSKKLFITKEQADSQVESDKLWSTIMSYTSEKFDVENSKSKNLKARLFTKNNTMLGCSIDAKVVESEVVYHGNKCGVLAGHAYAILDAFEVPKAESKKKRKTSRLLRIRNPWGFKEWNGKWSDQSDQLSKKSEIIEGILKERYKNTTEKVSLDEEDGTFLMCFSDFRKIFNKIFVCVDYPPNVLGVRFEPDGWTQEESGGIPINNTPQEMKDWASNPQYYLNVGKDNTEIYISLLQHDGRTYNDKFPYAKHVKRCCLIILRAEGRNPIKNFDNNRVIEISPVRMSRENSVNRVFEKGEYLIVPSIFKKGDTGPFQLELHFPDEFQGEYNEQNFESKLKYTKLQRLGKDIKRKSYSYISEVDHR